LPVYHASDLHAEIYQLGDELWLRDHGSSNGTFRNRERLSDDVPLCDGDMIHIFTNKFILRREVQVAPQGGDTVMIPSVNSLLPKHFVT
jgi:pSer/pThr/pTyr-binding forkhead associated (FHA) protein